MGRICHEHCPARVGVPWVLVLVAVGVWAVAQLLIAAGKTTLVVILGTALVAVGTTVAVAVCGAIRNLGTAASAAASVAEIGARADARERADTGGVAEHAAV